MQSDKDREDNPEQKVELVGMRLDESAEESLVLCAFPVMATLSYPHLFPSSILGRGALDAPLRPEQHALRREGDDREPLNHQFTHVLVHVLRAFVALNDRTHLRPDSIAMS